MAFFPLESQGKISERNVIYFDQNCTKIENEKKKEGMKMCQGVCTF